MKKLISKEDVLSAEVYSPDTCEYVVPSRKIKNLREYDAPEEQTESADKMLTALFNRCRALTHSSTCFICGFRDVCAMKTSAQD